VGKIFKVEAFGLKLLLFYFGFSFGSQFFKDAPVFPEYMVHIAHIRRFVFIEPVVVRIPALVGAEFLIHPAHQQGSAFEAVFIFHMPVFSQK